MPGAARSLRVNGCATLALDTRPTFGPLCFRFVDEPDREPPRDAYRVRAVDDSAELDAERALVERAQTGDREALGALLRKHGPRLYRSVLLPRLGSSAAAEEGLSRTYMKVVERFDQFTWQAVGVYPWLRVVALRVALDLLRARKREVLFEPEDVERELDHAEREAREADAIERHDLNYAKERVRQLLGRINPRYADAIRLRVLEERSRDEAAESLGVSVATFDVVLHRAMAALRKALSEGGTES